MAAGKDAPPLRIRPTRYRAGLRFWHCHEHQIDALTGELHYPADSFNPVSKVRFSARTAVPPRAMWYGAQSASAAIWETLLREVIGDAQGGVVLPRSTFAGWRVTAMRARREYLMLPLMPAPLRGLVTVREDVQPWLDLTQMHQHEPTHAPAIGLLADAARLGVPLDGLVWHSHQAGSTYGHPVVGVLYGPPASSADLVIDPEEEAVDLDDPVRGDELIDAALAEAGLWRYTEDLDAVADEPDGPREPKDPT